MSFFNNDTTEYEGLHHLLIAHRERLTAYSGKVFGGYFMDLQNTLFMPEVVPVLANFMRVMATVGQQPTFFASENLHRYYGQLAELGFTKSPYQTTTWGDIDNQLFQQNTVLEFTVNDMLGRPAVTAITPDKLISILNKDLARLKP